MKTALITGITGQDGSYLAELLLSKGYLVHGLVRRTSSLERSRLSHLYSDKEIYDKRLFTHYIDFDNPLAIRNLLLKYDVDEIYHLAGQSHVGLSFELACTTYRDNIMPTLWFLEVIRDLDKNIKFLHASSSEIFGDPETYPQTEITPHSPVTPYGCSKSCATQTVKLYRKVYDVFAVNCIMYNHESPRRGENFVSRKICRAAAMISRGLLNSVELGNISTSRDWGHARDYVTAMWLSLQAPKAYDYVISSGAQRLVSDILEIAFTRVNLKWQDYVVCNTKLMRASDPKNLVGDSSLAKDYLGWVPSYTFEDMVCELVDYEVDQLQKVNF